MDEREPLGKLAYDAYHADAITTPLAVAVKWEDQGYLIQQHWNAAAQAVAERVLRELQVSVEASE